MYIKCFSGNLVGLLTFAKYRFLLLLCFEQWSPPIRLQRLFPMLMQRTVNKEVFKTKPFISLAHPSFPGKMEVMSISRNRNSHSSADQTFCNLRASKFADLWILRSSEINGLEALKLKKKCQVLWKSNPTLLRSSRDIWPAFRRMKTRKPGKTD